MHRMSMMDVCPWAMWTLMVLVVILLLMLLWRFIQIRATAPGTFYFGVCASLFLLACAGVLHELAVYIGDFHWRDQEIGEPEIARRWEVFLSTSCNFVAFAAAGSSLFVVLGLGATALYRLVGWPKAADAA
ncbi:hypothetical protein [Verrucomicrobium spinosum]|nr:hypothetical protein [Verrucomicrobium spinosum]